jgi:hypothetical protein
VLGAGHGSGGVQGWRRRAGVATSALGVGRGAAKTMQGWRRARLGRAAAVAVHRGGSGGVHGWRRGRLGRGAVAAALRGGSGISVRSVISSGRMLTSCYNNIREKPNIRMIFERSHTLENDITTYVPVWSVSIPSIGGGEHDVLSDHRHVGADPHPTSSDDPVPV